MLFKNNTKIRSWRFGVVVKAAVTTDLLREVMRAKHKNLSFAWNDMENIWRHPVFNESDVFTEGGEAAEPVRLNRNVQLYIVSIAVVGEVFEAAYPDENRTGPRIEPWGAPDDDDDI